MTEKTWGGETDTMYMKCLVLSMYSMKRIPCFQGSKILKRDEKSYVLLCLEGFKLLFTRIS